MSSDTFFRRYTKLRNQSFHTGKVRKQAEARDDDSMNMKTTMDMHSNKKKGAAIELLM